MTAAIQHTAPCAHRQCARGESHVGRHTPPGTRRFPRILSCAPSVRERTAHAPHTRARLGRRESICAVYLCIMCMRLGGGFVHKFHAYAHLWNDEGAAATQHITMRPHTAQCLEARCAETPHRRLLQVAPIKTCAVHDVYCTGYAPHQLAHRLTHKHILCVVFA